MDWLRLESKFGQEILSLNLDWTMRVQIWTARAGGVEDLVLWFRFDMDSLLLNFLDCSWVILLGLILEEVHGTRLHWHLGTRRYGVEHCSICAHTRTTVPVVFGDVAHQGLEERSCVVHFSLEDVLVPSLRFPSFSIFIYLIAHLLGNDCCEGLENALFIEVPSRILCNEDHD